ncbi:TPA: hypothetical protein EYP66_19810 [Candidatus Poribacteria bacterium]|nr:hypothetical protein [Candidatus Poribacteria bacterium]
MMAELSPTLDEWRKLYEAAIRMKEIAPWESAACRTWTESWWVLGMNTKLKRRSEPLKISSIAEIKRNGKFLTFEIKI